MASISRSASKTTNGEGSSVYKFLVDRQDDGKATISLLKNGVVATIQDPKDPNKQIKVEQANAGWDDAIPWPSGSYKVIYGGANFKGLGAPYFKFVEDPDPDHREGILIHLGNQKTFSQAVEGCIGASADFLSYAVKALKDGGSINDEIPIQVSGDYSYAVSISAASSALVEGDATQFTISLLGAGSKGISKDIWFRLDVNKDANVTGSATYGIDYTIEPINQNKGGVKPNVAAQQKDPNKGNWKEGLYVKIPAGEPSATYKIKTISENDGTTEGPETIQLKIDDYFVVRESGGKQHQYSDAKTQPGVLIENQPSATITLNEKGDLVSEIMQGGIEGVRRTFSVKPGDVVSYNFDAYGIPDSLVITDGVTQVGATGFVSGLQSGTIAVKSNELTVIVVGNDPGTAWELALKNTPASPLAMASNTPQPSAVGQSFPHTPVAAMLLAASLTTIPSAEPLAAPAAVSGATLIPEASWTVTIPTTGEAQPLAFNVKAGHEYFVRMLGRATTGSAADIANGYIKILDQNDPSTNIINRGAGLSDEPMSFFQTTADTTVSFAAGSDLPGQGGNAQIELYDATALNEPVLDFGPITEVSGVEGEGVNVEVYRFGDVSKSATYSLQLTPSGSNPLSAADITNGATTVTLSFDAGQRLSSASFGLVDDGIAEGRETATLSFSTGGIPAETLANMIQLGLHTSVTVAADDPAELSALVFPTISVTDAVASEADGNVSISVTLSEPSAAPVTVAYLTVDGTAKGGEDYTPSNGTLTFAPGEVSKTVTVPLIRDTQVEASETFQFKILDATGGNLQDGAVVTTVTGTITDSASQVTYSALDPTSGKFVENAVQVYSGPANFLQYQILGNDRGEVVVATKFNDFVNCLGGDDAVQGREGDDVLDGGLGSNFLTGGEGNDTFFVDARSGGITWSTVTDFEEGEWATVWGWKQATSKLTWADMGGADGYKGATAHIDIDGNGSIDTSMTFTGKAVGAVTTMPGQVDSEVYLAFRLA